MDRPHGTYGEAQMHYRRGEKMCEPCREAYNSYLRQYRQRPIPRERGLAQQRAYQSAERTLRERYRDEFDELYQKALSEEMV